VLISCLAPVGAAHASNPLHGKWVANAPGGISYYWFSHGHRDKHDKQCDIGRFWHSYIDCYGGLVVLHGTWILHHHGADGEMEMLFDNWVHMTNAVGPDHGSMPLWCAGTGTALSYGRVH
jgi:hypothetical protein